MGVVLSELGGGTEQSPSPPKSLITSARSDYIYTSVRKQDRSFTNNVEKKKKKKKPKHFS